MGGGHVCPLHGQGRYGVVPPKAQDIVAICVLHIRFPHHTIGRWHPLRFPPNATSFEEQGETCTPPSAARFGWEGATGTVDECSLCSCDVGLNICSTKVSLVVS